MTTTRVRGLDAARGLALVGMVVAHLDTRIDVDPGVLASWRHVGDGRAAVLFVVVAGFSLALATGGTTPHTGRRLADDRLAVFVRAAVLAGVGALLTALGTPVAVILGSYAVFFIVALPFLRSGPLVPLGFGTLVAVTGPLLVAAADRHLPELRLDAVGTLFVGFPYPALQWSGFLLVGLGLGRIRLRTFDLGTLAVTGLAAGVILHLLAVDVREQLLLDVPRSDGLVATALMVEHRSRNMIEGASALAIAVGVLALLVLITPHARNLLYPLEAAGRMALTLYVAHIVGYWAAIQADPALEQGSGPLAAWTLVIALAGASAWFTRFGRGPLEWALHRVVVATTGSGAR